MTDLTGKTLAGRYRIESLLGMGGFGAVYEAVQQPLGRRVAVKTLHGHHAQDRELKERFLREARSTSRLKNQHTISLFDFGETDDGVLYMVMELATGPTLGTVVRGNKISYMRAANIVAQICESLHEAHGLGIVHRDLKPENIKVERRHQKDHVKVLDFGLAKLRDTADQESLTASGMILGTPTYLSPEQASGKDIGPPSDVYSLGILLYRMVTGRVPFREATPIATIMAHANMPPPPPDIFEPELPREFCALILDCLEKKPERRPAPVSYLRQRLLPFAGEDTDVLASHQGGSRDLPTGAMTSTPAAAPTNHWKLAVAAFAASVLIASLVAWRLLAGTTEELAPVPAAEPPVASQQAAEPVPEPRRSVVHIAPRQVRPAHTAESVRPRHIGASWDDVPAWTVQLSVASTPPGATVLIGDKTLGTTPLDVDVPWSTSAALLRIDKRGYQLVKRVETLDEDVNISEKLKKKQRGGGVQLMGLDE